MIMVVSCLLKFCIGPGFVRTHGISLHQVGASKHGLLFRRSNFDRIYEVDCALWAVAIAVNSFKLFELRNILIGHLKRRHPCLCSFA